MHQFYCIKMFISFIQLTVRGGSTINAHVEYASMDDGTAKIHRSTGQLTAASLGNIVSFSVKLRL